MAIRKAIHVSCIFQVFTVRLLSFQTLITFLLTSTINQDFISSKTSDGSKSPKIELRFLTYSRKSIVLVFTVYMHLTLLFSLHLNTSQVFKSELIKMHHTCIKISILQRVLADSTRVECLSKNNITILVRI